MIWRFLAHWAFWLVVNALAAAFAAGLLAVNTPTTGGSDVEFATILLAAAGFGAGATLAAFTRDVGRLRRGWAWSGPFWSRPVERAWLERPTTY